MGLKMQLWVLASVGVRPQWCGVGVWVLVMDMNLPMRKNSMIRAAAWHAVSIVERCGRRQDL